MSVRATARVEAPAKVEITLSLTMTAGEWQRLVDQLPISAHPAWRVGNIIREAIAGTVAHVTEAVELPA